MMQDHPIDLVRAELARVAYGLGQGLFGLMTALALIGLLWLTTLRPADAGGSLPAPDFTASATVAGHMGAAPLRLHGSALAQTGALATSDTVCRLEIDVMAAAPLPATCAPVPVIAPVVAN